MWRGPARLRVATKGGSFALNFPLAASRRNKNTRSSPRSGIATNLPLGSNTASCGCELACRTRSGPGSPFRSTGLLVDGIGADLIEVGMHRVDKSLSPIDREERGVDDLEQLLVGPGPRGRIDAVDVDAASMPLAIGGREGADIGEQRRCAVGSRLGLRMRCVQERPCRGESRASLQHGTPVDALVCGS